MKNILVLLLLCSAAAVSGQSVISSVNAGAYSGNNLSYSVGEIFVNPDVSPDAANSGLMGVLSRVEFYVGVEETITSDDVRVVPNPVSSSVFFELRSGKPVEQVFIYDAGGRLVTSKQITGNRTDLSELPNGIYFIRTNINNIQSFKIVKQ